MKQQKQNHRFYNWRYEISLHKLDSNLQLRNKKLSFWHGWKIFKKYSKQRIFHTSRSTFLIPTYFLHLYWREFLQQQVEEIGNIFCRRYKIDENGGTLMSLYLEYWCLAAAPMTSFLIPCWDISSTMPFSIDSISIHNLSALTWSIVNKVRAL